MVNKHIVYEVTAQGALEGLTSWPEFYEALHRNFKETPHNLKFALERTLFHTPDDFLSKWRHQVAREREVIHCGFSRLELAHVLPMFIDYYKEEFTQ